MPHLLAFLVLLLDVIATLKLVRSVRLSRRTKTINIILVWCIPLIWAVLVLIYSDEPPKKTGKFGKHGYLRSGYQNLIARSAGNRL